MKGLSILQLHNTSTSCKMSLTTTERVIYMIGAVSSIFVVLSVGYAYYEAGSFIHQIRPKIVEFSEYIKNEAENGTIQISIMKPNEISN